MSGKLPLMAAIKSLMDEVLSGPSLKEEREGPLAAELDLLANAKKLTLFAAGAATQKYMTKLADEQEVMAALADMIMEVFTMESAILRAQKIAASNSATAGPVALAQLYAARAADTIELAARKVIAAVAEGDALRTQMAVLRRLAKHDPTDTVALRRLVAANLVRAGKYSA
jgi:butyryl-CoA dehydrogenase